MKEELTQNSNQAFGDLLAIRPDIIEAEIEILPFKYRMDASLAVKTLMGGNYVLIVDYFSSGLIVLNELKIILKKQYKDQSFQGQREYRSAFNELSNRIVVEVSNHKLKVRKSPEIGWLKILYPETSDFIISFPQIQGLNSSWQWYLKGINIPGLIHKIHPFYGTYFPTRFEHIILFDNWLKSNFIDKSLAIDVGVGSGILSFLLLKHGFTKVLATDTNPNAIIGLKKDHSEKNIVLYYGDLFSTIHEIANLIVFNPPWLPASHRLSEIDKAIYYEEDLFSRFFTASKKHLTDEGRIVILFSNLAQLSFPNLIHPIEKEISKGGLKKEMFLQMSVGNASKKTKRNQNHRLEEKVELWVLKMNNE